MDGPTHKKAGTLGWYDEQAGVGIDGSIETQVNYALV